MLKFLEHEVTFREVPDEIALCINITNCPCHCPGCHSQQLWEDIGKELNLKELHNLIDPVRTGITCVCLMGGDSDPEMVSHLAMLIKTVFSKKVAWYSGFTTISDKINLSYFDYIKVGPYIEQFGPLDCKTTNQKFYRIVNSECIDETYKFWNHNVISE